MADRIEALHCGHKESLLKILYWKRFGSEESDNLDVYLDDNLGQKNALNVLNFSVFNSVV